MALTVDGRGRAVCDGGGSIHSERHGGSHGPRHRPDITAGCRSVLRLPLGQNQGIEQPVSGPRQHHHTKEFEDIHGGGLYA